MPNIKMMKTHVRNVIVLSLLIYSFAIVCFYFSAIMPIRKQLVFLEQKTSGLKKTVEQLKSEYSKKWDDEKGEVFKIFDLFQEKDNEKDVVLSEFFQISKNLGVNVEKTEPLEEESIGDTILKYSWKINCYADYPVLGTFFNQIENSPLFLCIESPSIQSEADRQTKKHRADFLLSTYRLKAKK